MAIWLSGSSKLEAGGWLQFLCHYGK